MASIAPFRQSNSEALQTSQQTAEYLRRNPFNAASAIHIPFISANEPLDLWISCEKYLISCLRTENDKSAHLCLEGLVKRFGAKNERVMGLHGLYQEAVAKDEQALEKVLQDYDEILAENPINMPIAKRKAALLRSLSRPTEAVDALVDLLEFSPTDIEAWAELSDLYFQQALYAQAIFCLEEVLVSAPNAWNIHARLGEILFLSSMSGSDEINRDVVAEALRRFCRSVELCDDYVRGYYGLKITSDKLLSLPVDQSAKKQVATSNDNDRSQPSIQVVQRLNELATSKLADIVRTGKNVYDLAELTAAKALLEQSSQAIRR